MQPAIKSYSLPLSLSLALGIALIGGGATGAVGAESRTVNGPEAAVFGATISTWAKFDPGNQILEAGITFPYAVVENAPVDKEFKVDAVVEFPKEVQETTFLNHLGLFWEPHGHEPEGRYTTPHFDFHLFGVTAEEAAAVDCSSLETRAPELAPAGWLPAVPPGADPKDFCVPLMGFHLVPETEFLAPGEWQPGLFDMAMVAGEYQGAFTFIEPMVTRAALARKQSFSMPVPIPAKLGRSTLYPTRFEAVFDPATDAYQLIFSDFKPVS